MTSSSGTVRYSKVESADGARVETAMPRSALVAFTRWKRTGHRTHLPHIRHMGFAARVDEDANYDPRE